MIQISWSQLTVSFKFVLLSCALFFIEHLCTTRYYADINFTSSTSGYSTSFCTTFFGGMTIEGGKCWREGSMLAAVRRAFWISTWLLHCQNIFSGRNGRWLTP